MKAIVYTQYGSPEVLKLKEVTKPTPSTNEVLVRIKATAVNSGDVRLRKADPFAVRFIFGLLKPSVPVLGSVFSGVVESIGSDVKRFKQGDEVFGHTDMKFGAYAEYISVAENSTLAIKPTAISHTEAASIPFGGVAALHFLKKVKIQPGQKVLIVGASGAVGSAAVQLAKAYGAAVTAVCSGNNTDLVKSFGADRVIDYTKEDFSKSGEVYDVIFDSINAVSVARALPSLTANGTLVLSAAGASEMLQGIWISLTSKRKVLTGVISHQMADVVLLKELIEAGKYKAVVDRVFGFAEMSAAHAYVERGHKRGNVAISVQ